MHASFLYRYSVSCPLIIFFGYKVLIGACSTYSFVYFSTAMFTGRLFWFCFCFGNIYIHTHTTCKKGQRRRFVATSRFHDQSRSSGLPDDRLWSWNRLVATKRLRCPFLHVVQKLYDPSYRALSLGRWTSLCFISLYIKYIYIYSLQVMTPAKPSHAGASLKHTETGS